jgi:hypothetical protein
VYPHERAVSESRAMKVLLSVDESSATFGGDGGEEDESG